MKISKNGLDLIKKYEGLKLEPYLCPANVPTIGYGATYYPGGEEVSMSDLKITELYAEELLLSMLSRFEKGVDRYVQVEINQNQFDALVSFAYNLGLGALKGSTLLRKVNLNPCDENISYQFNRWVKAGGRKLVGLVKRRNEEGVLYFS